ncbi:MAG TPA: DUF58 domain-containing protein [Terriglobales bacterium]
MSDLASLIPPAVEGTARPFKRLGVAFGQRFFVLLVLGFAWLAPAFVRPQFAYGMLAWDGLVLLMWAADLAKLPAPDRLKIRRSWLGPAALSVNSRVELTLLNQSGGPVHARVYDSVPPNLRAEPAQVEISARGRGEATGAYNVGPSRRGEAKLGNAYVRYQGPLRIAERWARVPLEQKVRVYPNLEEAKRYSIFLVRSRQIELEKRYTRMRGLGREFESLREYREGDEYRDVCWTAAARRGKLVTRIYQIERSQTVWIVIDAGRLMRARIGGLSKLDYAVNAALALSQVALLSGDRVGLLAYGRGIRQRVPVARGSSHLRVLMEQLASVREEVSEGDHLQTASRLLGDQKRRSLVVWLTDLAETSMTPEVIEAASQMMPRHLVLFVVIGQPDLVRLAAKDPEDEQQMYAVAAAQEMVHRRELLLARLRERGALAVEVSSSQVTPRLVNSYLEIKERSQL